MDKNKFLDNTTLKDIFSAQIIAIICFLGELSLCLAFFYSRISLSTLLISHIIILLAIAILVLIAKQLKLNIRMFIFILVETAIAGPLGSFTALISLIFYMLLLEEQTQLEKKLNELHPKFERNLTDKIFNSVRWHLPTEEISTEPFSDIIKYGTIIEKQKVLIKIKKYFKPEFTPLLFEAVNDSDNSIRVQAAAIIASVEEDFMKKYKEIESKLEEEKIAPSQIVAFFELCLTYSNTGIIDIDKKSDFVYRQIKRIAKYINSGKLKNNKEILNLKILISKILLLLNRSEEAFQIFSSIKINTEAFIKHPEAVKTYLNTAFTCKNFSGIREFISYNNQKIHSLLNHDKELMLLINTWQELNEA